MITDVTINQLKMIGKGGSFFFRYETATTIELYHENKGPVVFRAILKKDTEGKWSSAMQHFPPTILLLSPIRDQIGELISEVKMLRSIVEGAERRRILQPR